MCISVYLGEVPCTERRISVIKRSEQIHQNTKARGTVTAEEHELPALPEEVVEKVMAEEQELPALPEEIVEKVIARFSFPHILKARVLSKAWRSKFLTIASPGFSRWPHYCCILLCDGVVAYDANEGLEKKLALESRKIQCPLKLIKLQYVAWGPLLVIVPLAASKGMATVINVLTGRFRKISSPFPAKVLKWSQPLLAPDGDQEYRLLVTFLPVRYRAEGDYIYSSRSGKWTKALSDENDRVRYYYNSPADLDNKFLQYLDFFARDCSIIRLDLDTGGRESEVIRLGMRDDQVDWPSVSASDEHYSNYFVKCGDATFVVSFIGDRRRQPCLTCVSVFQLERNSSLSIELTRARLTEEQSRTYYSTSNVLVLGSSDRIYLSSTDYLSTSRALIFDVYSLSSNSWSRDESFPANFSHARRARFPFLIEPSLMNPFVVP